MPKKNATIAGNFWNVSLYTEAKVSTINRRGFFPRLHVAAELSIQLNVVQILVRPVTQCD